MTNIRALAEKHLEHTIEGHFGIPVILIGPDGTKYDKTKNGEPIYGQVLYSQPRIDLSTGEQVTVPDPVVVLRRTSLIRVPESKESWMVWIPNGPTAEAEMELHKMDTKSAVDGGRSLGKVRIPLVRVTSAE